MPLHDYTPSRKRPALTAGRRAVSHTRTADPRAESFSAAVLSLQPRLGNRAVRRLLRAGEAGGGPAVVAPEIEARIERQRGAGSELPAQTRAHMEAALGDDLAGVRVHDNGEAAALNDALQARAFTTGQDIFFARGEYTPGTPRGTRLIAHELAHVVQQRQGRVQRQLRLGEPDDEYEREAESVAQAVMRRQQEEEEEPPRQALLQRGLTQRQPEEEEDETLRQRRVRTQLLQRNGGDQQRPDAEYYNLEGVRTVRANMDVRFHRTLNYATTGRRVGDEAKRKLLASSRQYERAYGNFERVVGAGRAEARNQEFWTNICVGIGVGILLGVGAAFILPSTAAGAFTITASEAVTAAASAGGQALGGVAISTGITGALRPAGTEMEAGGVTPAVQRMRVWQRVSDIYRTALRMVEGSRNTHMYGMAAEYLIGEIRVHVAGGETQLSEQQTLDLMVDLVRADNNMQRYDAILADRVTALERLERAVNGISLDDYPRQEMEQDLWILWMAGLDDPSVLDLDAIEDYLHGTIAVLGPRSRLNVDFGYYTTSDDEREARDAARREAGNVRQRHDRLTNATL